jgi:serralysin
MATVTASPTTTNAIVGSILADTIWGESALQYMTTGDLDTVSSDFVDTVKGHYGNRAIDAVFAFEANMRQSYDAMAAVSNLTVAQTTDAGLADFVLVSVNAPRSVTEGFQYFPGTSFRDEAETDSWQVGAFNSGLKSLTADGEVGGGAYGNWTIMHELGHGVGLLHTHSEKKGLPPLPEIGNLDNERFSVMSYNPAANGNLAGHAVTYMSLDVAALQTLYGANNAWASGDSTYSLTNARTAPLSLAEGDMSIGRAFACIWDGGGEDTISYAGSGKSTVLNLNAATLDKSIDLGLDALRGLDIIGTLARSQRKEMFSDDYTAGASWSYVKGQVGGYSIANGAVIENATGGDRRDLLIGNEADNILTGGNGRDTLYGHGGNDVLVGGAGADTFVYSLGATIADFEEGIDILAGDWAMA